jgi:hypothetical protein
MQEIANPASPIKRKRLPLLVSGDFSRSDLSGKKVAGYAFLEMFFAALGCTFPVVLALCLLAIPGNLLRRTGYYRNPAKSRFLRLLTFPLVGYNFLFLYLIEPGVIMVATVMIFNTFPWYILISPLFILILLNKRFSWPFFLFIWGLFTVWPILSRYNVFGNVDYAAIDRSAYVRPLLYNEPGHPREAKKYLQGYHLLVRNMIISPDGQFVFATNFDPMDRSDFTIMPSVLKIPVDKPPEHIEYINYTYSQELAYDTKRDLLYIAGHSADRLAMASVSPFVMIKQIATADKPHNLVYEPIDDLLYVVHESSRCRIHQPGTLALISVVDSTPWLMSPFEPKVDRVKGTITMASLVPIYQLGELSLTNSRPPRLAVMGLGSFGLEEVKSTDSFIYSDTFLGIILEIARDSWKMKRWKFVGGSPRKVVYDEGRNLLYVGKFFRQEMSIYNGSSWEPIADLPVGINTRDIRIAGDGRVYVGSAAGIMELKIDQLLDDLGLDSHLLSPEATTETTNPAAPTAPVLH